MYIMGTEIKIDENSVARMVVLTYGPTSDGKAYWCYMAVKPTEYDRFNTCLRKGAINPHSFEEEGYGEILVSGEGLLPPSDVTRRIAKIFNCNIKDLFGKVDAKAVISSKIAKLKEEAGNASSA